MIMYSLINLWKQIKDGPKSGNQQAKAVFFVADK